jgi:16S rRNA processing protein RimM
VLLPPVTASTSTSISPTDRLALPVDPVDTPPDGLLEIGRIGRAHGVKGGLVVTLTSDRTERVQAGSRVFDGQQWLTVATSRSLPQHKWMVLFDGLADRNAAERFTGRVLWAEPLADADALWVHELIGAHVVDQSGVDRGVCVAVIDNPANDLLELDTGHLVPVTFVVSVVSGGASGSADGGVVNVEAPDGLFDLLD